MVIRTVTPAGFLVAVCILLTFSLSTFADERCAQWAAQLESAEGRVEWQSPQSTQWQAASSGFQFCYGDRVRVVQERAVLRLANDTLVRLQENSLVNLLPEEKGFWFELLEGAGHFLSRTPKQFTIKAPYLNAAVDGTEFVVNAHSQKNRVAVMEGDVRVSNDLGEVRLSEGTQTTATANTAPSPVQSIRLRDAAEWILYYPPLVVQVNAPAAIETLIQQENYGAALAELTANDITPETTALAASLAFNTGNIAQGEQLLSRALNTSPARVEAQALQALRTLIGGDSESALAQTTQLTQSHPQNPSALLAHAYAQQSHGKIEEALQTNLKAQALIPNNLFVLARTAELQLSVGNTRAAQKLINQALKQAPNHSRLNTLAGFIALNRFATSKAQNHFQTAIQTNSNEPLARLGLALALIQRGKIEDGRAQMEMAVMLDPGSSLLRSYLGKTYATQNQNDWADTQYQLAKNLDPNDPTPWFYEGLKKQQTGDLISAVKSFEKSRELNDNRAVYRSRLYLDNDSASRAANVGHVYNTLGFTQEAKDLGTKAISESPGEHSGHRLLAETYAKDNRYESVRASERLQATMLQPLGAEPLPLGLSETGLFIVEGAGPADIGINEYTRLFVQEGLRGKGTLLYGSQNTQAYDVNIGGFGKQLGFDIGHYSYESDGFRENNDVDYSISNLLLQWQPLTNLAIQSELSRRSEEQGDLGLQYNPEDFSENQRSLAESDSIRIGGRIELSKTQKLLISNTRKEREEEFKDSTFFPDFDFTFEEQRDINSEADIYDLQYILTKNSVTLLAGAINSEEDIESNDALPSPAKYNQTTAIDEQYAYIKFHSNDNRYSFDFGADYYSSHETFENADPENLIFTRLEEKISNKILPKVGARLRPVSLLEFQLAYHETYVKPLELQTELKPSHIQGSLQTIDGTTNTFAKSEFGKVTLFFPNNLTFRYERVLRDLMRPTVGAIDGEFALYHEPFDSNASNSSIDWIASPKISTKIEYSRESISRPGIPDQSDPNIPLSHKENVFLIQVDYLITNGIDLSLQLNQVEQNILTQASPSLDIEEKEYDESFFTLDAKIQYQLKNNLGKAALIAKNISNEKFLYADFNAFTESARIQRFIPEATIFIRIDINLD